MINYELHLYRRSILYEMSPRPKLEVPRSPWLECRDAEEFQTLLNHLKGGLWTDHSPCRRAATARGLEGLSGRP